MSARPRPSATGLSPGTEPLALWPITAVVLAGLILTGLSLARRPIMPGSGRAGGLPATTQAAVRGSWPGDLAPGPAAQPGYRMLAAAALASRGVAYQGVELMRWWGSAGEEASTLDVWHRPGDALTAALPALPGPPPGKLRTAPGSADDGGPGFAGGLVLGMSQRLATMLAANYELVVGGRGTVAGRPATVVTARRGGALAARFWLDSSTHLLLRRQMFGAASREVSDVLFVSVSLGRRAMTAVPAPAAHAWPVTLSAAQLARLRERGWPLPGPLPGRLTLLSARADPMPSGLVVDLDYSDGLSVISIFVQRGHLPAQLNGWSRASLQGHHVYAEDPDDLSVTWSAHGYVYTVISAAPRQTEGQVVAALPHDGGPGVLSRIRSGLRRIIAWLSP